MRRKDGVFWTTGCLTIILIIGSVASVAQFTEDHLRSTATVPEPMRGQALVAGTPHSPIVIDGDVNFNATAQAEGWPGNGTSGNPYIIEGLDIDLDGAPGHGISISNTRVNFTIRGCNLTFASVSPGSGIYLYNVTNGMLINNTCNSNSYGIYLFSSDSNTVADNNCTTSTYGIYLDSSDFNNVANNTCTSSNAGICIWSSDSNTVANNTCDSNALGIYIRSDSTSNTLVNNTCTSNSYGIYLDSFVSNTLFNNTCSYNSNSGIYLTASDVNTIANNTCDTNVIGIYIRDTSTSNTVVNNTCTSSTYGIYLDSSDFNDVANNTCSNNSNSGIYIWSSDSNTLADNTCDSNAIGIYIRDTSTSNTLVNNTCASNSYGIYLDSFVSNTLFNNTCSYNSNSGICLRASDVNTLANNTCDNNIAGIYIRETSALNTVVNNTCTSSTYGIYLVESDSNTVANNTCTSSSYGIYISDSDLNDIQWNVFMSSTNAYDGGAGNTFEYNYWSDYSGHDADGNGIGDTPYAFSGNQDLHPLMAPPGSMLFWLEFPIDQVIELGNPLRYDLNASVYGGLDHWWINDTLNFAIDQSGVITNNTFLLTEDYGLRVYVNDTSGYVLSGIFTVTVSDLSPPVWIESPTTQVLEFGSGFYYNLNASDYSGLDTWWINDTTHFAIDTSGIVTNITSLPVGIYGLYVWVNDTFGSVLDATFNVIVVDTTGPSWVAPPMNQELEEGTPFITALDADDLSGLHVWWVNDTDHFVVDSSGVVTNKTVLVAGVYSCEVWVNDTSGNSLSGIFTLTVHAASPPMWIADPIDQVVELGEALIYDLDVTDMSGIGSWWLNDTTYFIIDQDGTITNSTPLAVGIYGILISVSDTLGNIQSSEITITVVDITSPTTTPTTTGTTSEGLHPMVILALGLGIGGAALVAIAIVFLRKRT